MKGRLAAIGLGATLAFAGLAAASDSAQHAHSHGHRSAQAQPYTGQQNRAITSFSDDEISGLRDGRGLGFAKPAELNGYPGPLHVLELAAELGLTDQQRETVEAIFARMKQAAQATGARYLEAESAVDAAFRAGSASPQRIAELVRQADQARAEVRLAHLQAHIETAPLLTADQRRRYAELRGYADRHGGQGHHRQHRH